MAWTQRTDLIFEIIPPIRPCLLHTPLLLQDRVGNDGAQDAKRHSNAMVVITEHTNTTLELCKRLSNNFKTIIQLDRLNPEFR